MAILLCFKHHPASQVMGKVTREVPLLDACYERVREAGHVVDCAVLEAVGVTASGHRRVLGVSVALSEAKVHWRAFLDCLIQRGLRDCQR
jgi:putative transposase